MNLIDLIVSRFKHGRDLGELVGGYCQIGAWSLEDLVAVDAEKLFVKVAVKRERSSL